MPQTENQKAKRIPLGQDVSTVRRAAKTRRHLRLRKKVVGTMVVRTDGSRIELSRIILLRWLPLALVSIIPAVGGDGPAEAG